MKQLMVLLLVSGLILAGCQAGEEQASPAPPKTTEQEPAKSAFSPLPAVDVIEVTSSGEAENLNRFYVFLESAEAKEPDHIQIRQFTTEGDPVTKDIKFDGSEFKSILDTSRDQYGPRGVAEAVCDELTVTETAERTDYQLEGCENNQENHLLTVWN
ncbi:DUF4362 domain-containing protein [Planococcus sp. CAU13]|uniref:DUF4362 domain-containing protein n=1 Tax=Planococcus sp. CAU13 TaxID=1541197 RepID=UPI00052FDAE3|nr:DUF4362 domain-containing protein [Planococcus sp. CAU13]